MLQLRESCSCGRAAAAGERPQEEAADEATDTTARPAAAKAAEAEAAWWTWQQELRLSEENQAPPDPQVTSDRPRSQSAWRERRERDAQQWISGRASGMECAVLAQHAAPSSPCNVCMTETATTR